MQVGGATVEPAEVETRLRDLMAAGLAGDLAVVALPHASLGSVLAVAMTESSDLEGRGDPLRNPVARAQCASGRTGAAALGASRSTSSCRRRATAAVPVRSTGASDAIQKLGPVIQALQQARFVVDCTVDGMMHAPETPEILEGRRAHS